MRDAVDQIANPNAAFALQNQAFGQRPSFNVQISTRLRWVQVTMRRAHTPPVADCRLGHANAVLRRAIVITCRLYSHMARRLDDSVVQRTTFVNVGNFQRPVAAPEFVVATIVALHGSKERQDISITPAAIAKLSPGVEILCLAAHEHHAVDGAGPTQQSPPGHFDAAIVGVFLRFRRIAPIGGRVIDEFGEADRNTRPRMTGPTGFQQQNLMAAISAQAICENRPRRPRAYNDIIHRAAFHDVPSTINS